ncbi:MAG: glycerophosphodiester phosphodiesterase [Proteobacteria bacterium]|nr:glycerophosphodiester phosphodiesterase [Pseudomonadota bacterium]
MRFCLLSVFLFTLVSQAQAQATANMVIAINGAGKNLIEHSLPATTLAAAMGVEYLELHVVMTADNQLVVFHDLTLQRLTDVAEIFPDRKRDDGAYYVIDFTLDELRRLRLLSSTDGNEVPLAFGIPTLAEELGLLRRLETILERQIGLVLEIRQPWFHLQAGKDISISTLDTLASYRYSTAQSKLYLQCFDPDELQRVHSQLMPERQMSLPLIQLIGENDGLETKQGKQGDLAPYNYDWLFTNVGLRMVASYAVAIALPTKAISDPEGNVSLTGYIGEAHRHGLKVLAFPLNNSANFPSFAQDFSTLIDFYISQAGVDGVYTDSFRDVQRFIQQKSEQVPTPLVEEMPQLQEDLPLFFKNLNLSRPVPPDILPVDKEEEMLP